MKRSRHNNLMRALGRPLTLLACVSMLLSPQPAASFAQEVDDGGVDIAELSPETERSIERGLRYLAKTQSSDGHWSNKYPAANTATALMAFMLKGHFPGRGPYGEKLTKAVDWFIERGRNQNGYLGSGSRGMYEHGLATLALSEAWGEAPQDELRDALKAAVDVIFRSQHSSGGWRYEPKPNSHDISVTVMQIVALASAREAGILVPDDVLSKALRYVRSCQRPFDGGFAYQPGNGNAVLARSAAGVMSYYMLGQGDSPGTQRGLDYLLRSNNRKFNHTSHYYYAHYYAIQVMYQAGDANYQKWYPKIRDALLRKQRSDGAWHGGAGGSVYSTAMSILILGVPYRYLPIYQR